MPGRPWGHPYNAVFNRPARLMSSAWLLPEHIADVLPAQARRIEELRRTLLDLARSYGFELVMPPLLEYLESLLSGTGRELDLQTFKLVDQLSGRTLGLRADTTPQVARIDAHLLNRVGVSRLCYCGPVLHTRPGAPHATREPLQFGAEIYGHAGLEADLEVQELALDGLRAAGSGWLGARPGRRAHRARRAGRRAGRWPAAAGRGRRAGAPRTAPSLHELTAAFPAAARAGAARAAAACTATSRCSTRARQVLPRSDLVRRALDDLAWLAATCATRIRRCASASTWPT